jgi:hypothetical protein
VITVSSNKSQVREGKDATITFTANPTTHPQITVNYSTAGSATFNTDYSLSGTPSQVVIPVDQASASITLHAITDTVKEPAGETAKVMIEPGSGYQVSPTPRTSVLILD